MSKVTPFPVARPWRMVLGHDGCIHDSDAPFAQALGYSPRHLVGRPFEELLADGDRPRFSSALARTARGDAMPGSLDLWLPGIGAAAVDLDHDIIGARSCVQVSLRMPCINPDDHPVNPGGPSGDPDVYQTAFEHAFEPMLLIGADGRILHANPAAARFMGREREELEGSRIDTAVVPPAGLRSARAGFRRAAADGTLRMEAGVRGDTQPGRSVEWRIEPLPEAGDAGGPQLLVSPRDLSEERRREARNAYLAQFDQLTGLRNRKSFQAVLEDTVARWQETGGGGPTVVLLNLDSFREINAALGNRVGDDVLRTIAQRLSGTVRGDDIVARLSGDVFALLMDGVDLPARPELARRLLDCVAGPIEQADQEIFVTACLGMASASEHVGAEQDLVYCAEVALNDARHRGRDAYVTYSDATSGRGGKRLRIASELRRALQREEFELFYQPQLAAESGEVAGLEALLRWNHPEHGLVPPAEFIPLLEQTSLIVPVGEWVVEQACQELARLEALGYQGLRMAVNISPRQLEEPGFVGHVAAIVRAAGVSPGALELELTESLFLSPVAENEGILEQLAGLGIRLAVDDFGTGYSALAYLKRVPVRCLKIDKSFIDGVGRCDEDSAIVNAICHMASHLGLDVVAEGVETQVQVDYLRGHPGVLAQGFHYARPMPLARLLQCIKRERETICLAS